MEGELIAVSFISGLFMLISVMIINHNWFKKENFKIKRDFTKKEMDIKIKKLYKDAGLNIPSSRGSSAAGIPSDTASTPNNLLALLPLLKKLPPELIEKFIGLIPEEIDEHEDTLSTILKYAQPLLEGLGNAKQTTQEEQKKSNIVFEQ